MDASGTATIMPKSINAKCTHIFGIPHEALTKGKRVRTRLFGICMRYTINSISNFPDHISYISKCYKGGSEAKFDSFQKEEGMQFLHLSIVKCIEFTMEAPWITTFPYYIGGKIGDIMRNIHSQNLCLHFFWHKYF